MSLVNNFIELFILSSPWLLLGLFIAALINVYLPRDFLNRHLGKEGVLTTIKAALIGAPMPLCSCGVIPAALGLRRAGASKSATTAFLVSTPETGIDSISVSYILLGPFMAIIRPVAAVCSAITAGLLVGSSSRKTSHNKNDVTSPSASQKRACCNTKAQQQEQSTSCCASKPKPDTSTGCCSSNVEQPSTGIKIKQAFAYSANKLLSDTAKWLVIGLFFAALVQTYVPKDFLLQHGSGVWAMLAVIVISIPMYICATSSTPIAAGLLLAGVSPGAVLVFMLAGPATNIATLGVVLSELGKRAAAAYLTGVIGVALLFGFLTDYLVLKYDFELAPSLVGSHHVLPLWVEYFSGAVLAGLLVRLLWLKLRIKRKCAA